MKNIIFEAVNIDTLTIWRIVRDKTELTLERKDASDIEFRSQDGGMLSDPSTIKEIFASFARQIGMNARFTE